MTTYLSLQVHTSDGTLQSAAFVIPFLDVAHLHYYIDDNEITTNTAYLGVKVSSVTSSQVNLTAQVPTGSTLKVQRETPRTAIPHVFTTGAALFSAQTVDNNNKYMLYVVQEAYEQSGQGPFPARDELTGEELITVQFGGAPYQVRLTDLLATSTGLVSKDDLANQTDPLKGGGLVGVSPITSTPTFTEVLTGTVLAVLSGIIGRVKLLFVSGPVNVMWYMSPLQIANFLSGTTTMDFTDAIQAAINSRTKGGEVRFPAGDYISGPVTVNHERTSLVGDDNATIYIADGGGWATIGNTDSKFSFCHVRNLRFDRLVKSDSVAECALKFVNTAYCSVSQCAFKNSFAAIWVKTHNDSLHIHNNVFYDGTFYGVYEYNENEAWANDLRINENFFWHVEFTALFMGSDGVGTSSIGDTYFHHNVVVSAESKGALQTKHAVRAVGAGTYCTNIRVENNIMEGLSDQFLWLEGLNRSPVIGNYFSGTNTNDVGLYFGGGVGNSQICRNTFIGFNSSGAFIYNTGGLTLEGNHFASNVTLGGSAAELTLRNLHDVTINGNFFFSSSSKWAIDATQADATFDNVIYTNNRFAKAAGNTNYQYDIRHNNYGGGKVMLGNIGNDVTSGKGLAAPVAGMALQWYPGDKIENKTATELGTTGGKYTIDGWVNVVQGDPGTWVQRRTLTGN